MSETLAELCFFVGQQHHAQAARQEELRDFTGAQLNFATAEQWYYRALSEDPTIIKIHEAMMYALISQRRHGDALPHCDVAMKDPDPNKQLVAQVTRGLTEMMVGDYRNGFKDLHARLKLSALADVPYRHKIEGKDLWDGKPVDHLLVYGEQGFGDVIMFSRFLREIIERGLARRITLEIDPAIVSLMCYNLDAGIEVIAYQQETVPSDAFTLMVSVPAVLGTTIDTVPEMPLIEAELSYDEKWRYISKLKGLKVGIAWAGRPAHDVHTAFWNAMRGISLKAMEPVLSAPEVSFVSLQKGPEEKQLADFPSIHEFSSDIKSWSDTAGIIHHLDLVISIDSGPVHLAAAMGKPTWLLNHSNSCWRWKLEGNSTPWYDNVRVFRQEREGDWSHPVSAVAVSLSQMARDLDGKLRDTQAAA